MQTDYSGEQSPTFQKLSREQDRSRRTTLPITSSRIVHFHYELEFECPSSSWARQLFADAERALVGPVMIEMPQNGKSGCHRSMACSSSHNNTWTGSSSSSSSHQQSPSSSQLSVLGTYTRNPFQTSPEREKRKSEEVVLLGRVPEDGDAMVFHSPSGPQDPRVDQEDVEYSLQEQTAVERTGSAPIYLGGQALTIDDEDEEEEEQWILDEELARRGLYRGSYGRLMALYSLTPIFTFLIFLVLAYLPKIAYPLPADTTPGTPYPHSLLLPFPLPEVLAATAFWALSHLLNSFIFSFFSSILVNQPIFSLSLSSLIQSSLGVILRQVVVPILLIPRNAVFDHPTWHDISFRRTWWIALGWAAAEAIVGIKQGYDGIALYRDVLVSVRRVVSTPNQTQKQQQQHVPISGYGSVNQEGSRGRDITERAVSNARDLVDVERQPLLERRRLSVTSSIVTQNDTQLKSAIEEEVERDVEELIALRGREELEDVYGMPFIRIPIFISCLHRLNSALFVVGSTLLITAAYLSSSLSLPVPNPIHDSPMNPFHRRWMMGLHGDTQLLITFPLVVVLQWILLLLHTSYVLPRIGVQTFVYVGFMLSLGVFFAGLAVWEGIV